MSATGQSDPFAQFRKTYFEECDELLESLHQNLGVLQDGEEEPETLHAIFRAVHSIKGGAGAFGLDALVSFSHVFESLLDAMRERRIDVTPDVIQLLLQSGDALVDIVCAARGEKDISARFGEDLIESMNKLLKAAPSGEDSRAEAAAPVAVEPLHDERAYRVTLVPHAAMFEKANEPLLLIRQLMRLGQAKIEADCSRLPSLDDIEPEGAYLSWVIELRTRRQASAIQDVFEFVEGDCELSIEAIDEVSPDIVTDADVPADKNPGMPKGAKPAGSAHVAQTIRVDVEKVDRLVNLVGELVITQAMLTEQSALLSADSHPNLLQGIEALAQSARELQESVMAMRAQPVKSVFARMPRVVREIAAVLGKEVRIVTTGEMTEIDKTVIEHLADPLTHMIRNALDHGIEPPDERAAAGKARQGTIQLSAAQRSGRIIIDVSDDGRGINRDKILSKAISRGVVAPDAKLSDEDIDHLIFLPAFSTADTVSNISGRGVGMDVVKRNVQSLGGRISIQSRLGHGSKFTLSLPLTLAVVDGMVVSVGNETFIVPLTAIIESLRPIKADIHRVVGRGDVLMLRGEYMPLVYLHRCFRIDGAVDDPCAGIVIIVQSENSGCIGLVVDDLVGQQQVVVKSLEANYQEVVGVGGATILGNGRVALILDVGRVSDAGGARPPASYATETCASEESRHAA